MLKNKIIIHDVGAANFIPAHFPLVEHVSFIHFDPDPRGIKNLKDWLAISNSKAQHDFAQIALGNCNGYVNFDMANKNTSSSIIKDSHTALNECTVQCDLHSNFVKSSGIELPDIIKIDVEGYEYEVLQGIDLSSQKLKVIEIEVSLNHSRLDSILEILLNNNFVIEKLRIHGDQADNPRNYIRGKLHGLLRKLGIPRFLNVHSEQSWSDIPSTSLTQIELVLTKNFNRASNDFVDSFIADVYGLCFRKSSNTNLMMGNRKARLIDEFLFIR